MKKTCVREKAMWKSRVRRRLCVSGKPARDGEGRAQGGGPCTRV